MLEQSVRCQAAPHDVCFPDGGGRRGLRQNQIIAQGLPVENRPRRFGAKNGIFRQRTCIDFLKRKETE